MSSDRTADRGKSYAHLIFPDKQTILPGKLLLRPDVSIGMRFKADTAETGPEIIFPVATLTNNPGQVFRRLDTHLTELGTILVANEIAKHFAAIDGALAMNTIVESLQPVAIGNGDLGSKLDPALSEMSDVMTVHRPGKWLHNSLAGGNNGMVDIRFNPIASDNRRVLLFGDSFGRELAKILSFIFAQVVFLRTPYVHYDLVDQIESDIIISENVERYLPSTQADDTRPSFHMFPFLGQGSYSPTKEFTAAFSGLMANNRSPYVELAREMLSPSRV